MNGDVSREAVQLAFRSSKVTAAVLLRALRAGYRLCKNKIIEKSCHPVGQQSVKKLIRQGQGVSSMDVSDESIRTFKRIANKYGMDFAIVKDKTGDNPKYTIFFKAKDADAISQVMKEYSAKLVKKKQRAEKPSVLEKFRHFKAIIAQLPQKALHKRRERAR